MTEAATVDPQAPTARPGKLPPALRLPKIVVGVAFAVQRRKTMRDGSKHYGPVFAINLPHFGRTVIVSDPALVRSVFTASTDDLVNVQPNLSRIFGPGSVFALDGKEHRDRRKLLAPPFHGQSIKNYEKVIEGETSSRERHCARAQPGRRARSSRTLEPMNRITLNVILRTVFGAAGESSTSCARSSRRG